MSPEENDKYIGMLIMFPEDTRDPDIFDSESGPLGVGCVLSKYVSMDDMYKVEYYHIGGGTIDLAFTGEQLDLLHKEYLRWRKQNNL